MNGLKGMKQYFKRSIQVFSVVMAMTLGACASTQQASQSDVYDPLEPMNRAVFAFNEGVDYILLNPLTEIYRFIVPDPIRVAVGNVLSNLKSPIYLANELLQGDLEGAGIVTQRFVFNTFTGFGGILDTASWEGIEAQPEDFGQTLAVWGVGSGPYLVLPIIGPSNARDTVGFVGDMAMDPVNWYIWNNDKDDLGTGRLVATILTTKDNIYDLQKDLKANSLDYYAAVRSVMTQRRNALINDSRDNDEAYPEYD